MIRTQIQLTAEQASALKRLAGQQGISMAEIIRQAVDQILAESERRECRGRALAVLGRYHDQATDVAVAHDRYLDEVYGSGNLR